MHICISLHDRTLVWCYIYHYAQSLLYIRNLMPQWLKADPLRLDGVGPSVELIDASEVIRARPDIVERSLRRVFDSIVVLLS
jgi:hypothetical protein